MDPIVCVAEISIQGDRALRFVNCAQGRAVYDVIGFNNPAITIIDYRRCGLNAIHALLGGGDAENFASEFNLPARVELQNDHGNILIELNDPQDEQPGQMLWIAVGLQESIPVYEYLFESMAPLGNNAFSFVALFNIPFDNEKAKNYFEDSLGFGCE